MLIDSYIPNRVKALKKKNLISGQKKREASAVILAGVNDMSQKTKTCLKKLNELLKIIDYSTMKKLRQRNLCQTAAHLLQVNKKRLFEETEIKKKSCQNVHLKLLSTIFLSNFLSFYYYYFILNIFLFFYQVIALKNYEKCFLFHQKSSFSVRDIKFFVIFSFLFKIFQI